MRHGRAEHDHAPALAGQVHNLAAGGRDDCILAHCLFHLLGHEFAGADVQRVKLGECLPRLRRELREESLVDEFLEADGIADFVQDVLRLAYHSALEPVRRRRAADDPHLGIYRKQPGDERAVHSLAVRWYEVALVDDTHIAFAYLCCPAEYGLHTAHDNVALCLPSVQPGGTHANVQIGCDKGNLLGVLLQKLLRAGNDERAASPRLHRVGRYLPQDPALAGADGHFDARIRLLSPQVVVDRPHGVFLIVSKSHEFLRSCLFDLLKMHLDPRVPVGFAHFDYQLFYLRIVVHRPGVCERVEEAFEGVVHIAPTPVLRV